MHADSCHICTGRHSRYRKIFAKIKVGTVSFVHQYFHSMLMSQLRNGSQVGTNTIVSGIVNQHCLRIRILLNGFFHICHRHSQRNTQLFIDTWIDINRNRTAYNQCINGTAMYIARHDNFIPAFTYTHNHTLYGGSSTVNHKKGMLRAKSTSCQFFCFFNYGNRMTQII